MAKMAIADQVLQRQDKDGMLRRALERIIQLYTDKSHFVYELLQNAEDAGATKIKFEQYADRLVVLHDGHPFSEEDLDDLCNIGTSHKPNDLNKIGKFGVGFKSVFGICETVRLYGYLSKEGQKKGYHQFAVEIKDFTHPEDIDDQKVDAGYTTKFVFPYSVGLTFSGFTTIEELNEVLSKRLQNLGITTLLFMKHLQSIDYKIELPKLKASGTYLLEKTQVNDHCSLVSAMGETVSKKENEEISYLVFSRPVTGIQAGRTIDIAFAVTVEESGDYTFSSSKSPYISVYFPTETESKLKFIVQGPYRTTPNRSSVPADDKDNIDLAEQTADLLRDSVIELRDSGKLNFSFLNILPVDKKIFYSAPLFKCMFDETESMMTEEELLLCKDGTYASADSVKIARGADFADVLSEELLTELLDDGTDYHWLPTFLTETNNTYKGLYDFLTDVLNIEVIRPENLRNAFNNNHAFLPRRDDEWLIKFYNMYDSVGGAFEKKRGGSNMLTAEIIKTSKGTFVAPYRKSDGSDQTAFYYHGYENASYLPNIFLPAKNIDDTADIAFIDEYIYEQCKHFFTEILNLQKLNEYEFFIRDFKKRYENDEEIGEEQSIRDLTYLIEYHHINEYKKEIDGLIKEYVKVWCFVEGNRELVGLKGKYIHFCETDDGFSADLYYRNIAKKYFLDLEYYEKKGIDKKDFLETGIVRNHILARDLDIVGEYPSNKPGKNPEWHSRNLFRWDLKIDCQKDVLEYIEKHPENPDAMAKSAIIFSFLIKYEKHLNGYLEIGGSLDDIPNAYADIIRILTGDWHYIDTTWGGKWLFNKNSELVSQKSISKYDLNPELYGAVDKNSRVYKMLRFAQGKDEKREKDIKDYESFDNETKDQLFESELEKRYGISKEEFEEKYNSFSINEDGYENLEEEFPSVRVKNWDSLKKHVAELLVYANPVVYAEKVRRIRISKGDSLIKAYLKGMYRVGRGNKVACQMCHNPVDRLEKCQLSLDMEKELDVMYLCMCPNCAAEYREMRYDEQTIQNFKTKILNLEEKEINSNDPIKIDCGTKSIWFTQIHVAEIRELLRLKEEFEND